MRGRADRLDLKGRARARLSGAAALLALALAGCGSLGSGVDSLAQQTGTSAFISPGRFEIYTCSDIDQRAQIVQQRKSELEQLMGRSSAGAGGSVVNTIAYRAEYQQNRDELAELSKASADKQCASKSQWSSGRAVF